MCGRYVRRGDKQKIAEAFHVRDVPDFAMPDADYNVAPTTFQPIIRESRETGEREMVLARWGLVPMKATKAAMHTVATDVTMDVTAATLIR